jgi:hypothetical protein
VKVRLWEPSWLGMLLRRLMMMIHDVVVDIDVILDDHIPGS